MDFEDDDDALREQARANRPSSIRVVATVRLKQAEPESKCDREDTLLEVSVGAGKQTIKWLGIAIGERLKLGGSFDRGIAVDSLRNFRGELLDPSDRIYEHTVGSELSVIVDVVEALSNDEFGNPDPSQWQFEAFVHAPSGRKWLQANSMWRRAHAHRAADEVEDDEDGVHGIDSQYSLVHIGMFSQSDVDTAFELDWNHVNLSAIRATEAEKVHIRNLFKKYYGVVCNIFVRYCGEGQVGQQYGLSLREFGHICHSSRLRSFTADNQIEKTFMQVVGEPIAQQQQQQQLQKPGSPVHFQRTQTSRLCPLLSRKEFVEALVSLCQSMMTEHNAKKVEGVDSARIVDEVEICLAQDLTSFWDVICREAVLYSSDDVLQYFRDNNSALLSCYSVHALSDDKVILTMFKSNMLNGTGLAQRDFAEMLDESGFMKLLPSGSKSDAWAAKALRYLVEVPCDGSSTQWEPFSHLCYCEFLEAIAILSIQRKADGLSDMDKLVSGVRLFIEHGSSASTSTTASQLKRK